MILRIAYKQRIVRNTDLFTAYYPYIPDFDVRTIRLDKTKLNPIKINVDYIVDKEEGEHTHIQLRTFLNYLREE